MRVLLVNDYGYEAGGAETYVFALRDQLRSRGHAVRLVADRPRLVHYVSRVFNPWYLFKFLAVILAWRPDVIHINKYNLVYSFLPALAGRILRKRVIITLHDVGLFCPDGLGLLADGTACAKMLDRKCFGMKCFRSTTPGLDVQRRLNFCRNMIQVPVHGATAALFLSPSAYLSVWGARYYGARSLHLPLFTDIPEEPPPPPAPPAPELRVFFAGRLVKEKGLQFAIAALAGLPVRLLVAGTGPYRPALEALARERGVASQVEWLGKIPNAEVAARVAGSHACVLPSLWLENNPVFAYEAMKGARALVGADIGGLPDLIEDGVNGFLFPPGNAPRLADVYRRLLAEPERLAELGRNGHAKARREYTPEVHLARLLEYYRGGP